MRNKKTKNFLTPLHLACGKDDLRPLLSYVHFKDGFAYATDAHILVKSSLLLHDFTSEEIAFMEGKFIHRTAFAEIFKYYSVSVTETGFHCEKDEMYCHIYFSRFSEGFPNCEKLLSETISKTKSEIDKIGVNANLLALSQKLLVDSNSAIQMVFTDKHRAILVIHSQKTLQSHDQIVLVMPYKLT